MSLYMWWQLARELDAARVAVAAAEAQAAGLRQAMDSAVQRHDRCSPSLLSTCVALPYSTSTGVVFLHRSSLSSPVPSPVFCM